MQNILSGLNPEQLEAVTYREGPLLIIAGAGTGKTAVITRRISWLLSENLAKTDEILALTFTDKAACEMQERVDLLVPYGYTDIWISTFHSFGDRVLRENALRLGFDPDFKVLTRPEAAVFFKEHLFKFSLSYYRPLSDPAKFIDAIITYFSRLKDEDITSCEYLEYAEKLRRIAEESKDDALSEEAQRHTELSQCFSQYQDFLAKSGKVDFANQFYLALGLLRTHPAVLKCYQEKFKYILVDEFQDTNFAQFQIVKLLTGSAKNITVVADDDQCIYRFRGAAYSNILNFIEAYSEAKKITLIKNYRSTQKILDSAYRLIQYNNPDRFEVKSKINKKLIGFVPDGIEVKHVSFDTVSSEADYVANAIEEKVKCTGYNYTDFAILVRSNNDADPFLRALNMLGIPWCFSGNQGLYSRQEVRLCISFLKLMANIEDSLSVYHLLISEIYQADIFDLSPLMHYAQRRKISLFSILRKLEDIFLQNISISERTKTVIEKFIADMGKYLEASKNLSTGRLLYLFLNDTGYISSLTKNPSAVNEEKICNIAKFFDIVRNYESLSREDRVIYFVEHLKLLMEAGDDPATIESDLDSPAVQVLTVHKAKGLEFNVVFMVTLVQGRFPWPRRAEAIELPDELIKDILPSGDSHLEEERRLFYVGMTRAKKDLIFTSSLDYGGKKTRKASRFIFEALGILQGRTAELRKSSGLELIKQNAPPLCNKTLSIARAAPEEQILSLSYYQIDDHRTCPLKYKYVHILRVPIMEHHAVLYGKAMHEAVLKYYQSKMNKIKITQRELVSAFDNAFKAEGFLSSEHIEERRRTAYRALARFFVKEEKEKILPVYMEKDFSFFIGTNKVNGRWDRIDIVNDKAVIIDFKTSEVRKQKDADKKAKESLQLSIYALAYKAINNVLPERVELHFLESGLVGSTQKDDSDLEKTIEIIKEAASGIRLAEFPAKPKYLSCAYCAYNQICPYAAIQR
ncbi:MAG: ATP-dependent DNA helicase [Candidatus Omnitrophota bacterium]